MWVLEVFVYVVIVVRVFVYICVFEYEVSGSMVEMGVSGCLVLDYKCLDVQWKRMCVGVVGDVESVQMRKDVYWGICMRCLKVQWKWMDVGGRGICMGCLLVQCLGVEGAYGRFVFGA